MSDPTREDRTVPPKLLPQDTASSADDHTGGVPASASSDDDFSFLGKPLAKDELGRLDHFRILKELGRGGMGCVLLGEDTKLDRQVALKVMLPQFAKSETAKARFLREAKAAAKIRHDHVISIHAVGEANGVPYIAMEFLTGMPLDKYLKEKGDVPLPTVMRIGREIALGLQAAHKLGLIHRDIKPANVWLEAPKGRVKILDFGLARREEDGEAHLTQSGAIVGTPAYMAPEQASGEKLDGRADLFSLGVLLYRLTTGQAAFNGPTTTAMLLQVMTHEPSLASEVKPTVPLEMARIIAKLMAKKKEERYASAAEFLADWERLMKAPKVDAPTQTAIKASEPERPARGKPSATQTINPPANATSLGARARTARWLALGVAGLLIVAVAAWFLIPRDTNRPLAKKDDPPPVHPAEKDPPPLDATNAKEVQAGWAVKLKVEVEENSPKNGIVMTLIPPGDLVKYPYRLGKYEVTQGEWASVMGTPVGLDKNRLPKVDISWYDSVEFCNKLSEREGLKPYYDLEVKERKGTSIEEAEVKIVGGPGYHIPTDAEWEHGCRAGTMSKYCFGDNDAELGEYAWYDQNSGKKSHPVGELKPNGFGLYDIHGNVREWNEEMLKNATTGAPERVARGGHWAYPALNCAVSNRHRYGPATRHNYFGLRLARVPWGGANFAVVPPGKEPPPLDAMNAKEVQAVWAAKLKVPVEEKSPTGIVMTLIPPGDLVNYPYRLGKYEVTQGEWVAVMGPPVGLEKHRLPMAGVSWYESVEFCNKLSVKEGLKPYYDLQVKERKGALIEDADVKIVGGTGYHIPTDGEWEHGCRAGTHSKYCFGDNDAELAEYAWYDQNSENKAHPVGELKANGFGLYDIHGNVREWNEEMLKNATTGAPERVHRGGHWPYTASYCAVSHRARAGPAYRSNPIGLRLARVLSSDVESKLPPPLNETNAKEVQSAWAAKLKVEIEEKSPKTGIVMTLIPPGELVKYPYRLGKYEVTQGEWATVMGQPVGLENHRLPKADISWFDSVEFCNKLSEREGLKPYYDLQVKERKGASIEDAEVKIVGGAGYHISTDAEWDFGCRAGTKGKYCFGDNDAELAEYAWYDKNSGKKSHPVGELKPNGFGLYDIHGNVHEWNEEMLKNAITGTPERVPRGGSWALTASSCEVSNRPRLGPAARSIGLRLAQTLAGDGMPPALPVAKEPPPLDATNAKQVQAAWAGMLKVEVEEKSPKTGIAMILIPPGELVKYPYRLGKYEVTQGEWEALMGHNPSVTTTGSTKLPKCPVVNVTWFDCVEFCNKLSEREGLAAAYELTVKKRKGPSIEDAEVKILGGPGYRIPTIAEWEHGCLAGSKGKYCFGDDEAQLAEYAWYEKNSGKKSHPVGELKPNGFGLHDVHGNVREWNEEMLTHSKTGVPERVFRGGAWLYAAEPCAASLRSRYDPANGLYLGLRLARVP